MNTKTLALKGEFDGRESAIGYDIVWPYYFCCHFLLLPLVLVDIRTDVRKVVQSSDKGKPPMGARSERGRSSVAWQDIVEISTTIYEYTHPPLLGESIGRNSSNRANPLRTYLHHIRYRALHKA